MHSGHQLGNSIAVLRQYHALGVRYVTLTHLCHNAFADSCGFLDPIIPLHGGLRWVLTFQGYININLHHMFINYSSLGYSLIDEMNRLGVLVDLSHTSDSTATQALKHSKAPVIWSHSSARAVHDVARNVPDSILRLVGTGEGQTDAVVMVRLSYYTIHNMFNFASLQVNFAPYFVAVPGNATVDAVADHVDHIARVAGKQQ